MRREFTKEFKRDAISLVIDQGYSRAEASRSLGIYTARLGRWIREDTEDGEEAFWGKGKLRSEQEEIRQLREENKRLKLEKEILKNNQKIQSHPLNRNSPEYIQYNLVFQREWPFAY